MCHTNWSFWQAFIIFLSHKGCGFDAQSLRIFLILLALEIGPEKTKLSSLFPFTGHSTSYEYRYYFVQCVDSTDTVSNSPLLGGSVIYSWISQNRKNRSVWDFWYCRIISLSNFWWKSFLAKLFKFETERYKAVEFRFFDNYPSNKRMRFLRSHDTLSLFLHDIMTCMHICKEI